MPGAKIHPPVGAGRSRGTVRQGRLLRRIGQRAPQRRLIVLMAEQNFNQAIKIADRAYVLVHGRIEFEGNTADLADNPMIKRYDLGG